MCMNSEKYEEKTIKTSKKAAHMSTAVEGLGDEGILNLIVIDGMTVGSLSFIAKYFMHSLEICREEDGIIRLTVHYCHWKRMESWVGNNNSSRWNARIHFRNAQRGLQCIWSVHLSKHLCTTVYDLAFGVTTAQHPSRGHHTVPPEEPLGSSI